MSVDSVLSHLENISTAGRWCRASTCFIIHGSGFVSVVYGRCLQLCCRGLWRRMRCVVGDDLWFHLFCPFLFIIYLFMAVKAEEVSADVLEWRGKCVGVHFHCWALGSAPLSFIMICLHSGFCSHFIISDLCRAPCGQSRRIIHRFHTAAVHLKHTGNMDHIQILLTLLGLF